MLLLYLFCVRCFFYFPWVICLNLVIFLFLFFSEVLKCLSLFECSGFYNSWDQLHWNIHLCKNGYWCSLLGVLPFQKSNEGMDRGRRTGFNPVAPGFASGTPWLPYQKWLCSAADHVLMPWHQRGARYAVPLCLMNQTGTRLVVLP